MHSKTLIIKHNVRTGCCNKSHVSIVFFFIFYILLYCTHTSSFDEVIFYSINMMRGSKVNCGGTWCSDKLLCKAFLNGSTMIRNIWSDNQDVYQVTKVKVQYIVWISWIKDDSWPQAGQFEISMRYSQPYTLKTWIIYFWNFPLNVFILWLVEGYWNRRKQWIREATAFLKGLLLFLKSH
jgi:hypothetical protein